MCVCVCVLCTTAGIFPPLGAQVLFLYHARNTLNTQLNSHRRKCRGSSSDKTDIALIESAPVKPNEATCAGNYTHGNYNVLHHYLEPCAKLGGPLEAAFEIPVDLGISGADVDDNIW